MESPETSEAARRHGMAALSQLCLTLIVCPNSRLVRGALTTACPKSQLVTVSRVRELDWTVLDDEHRHTGRDALLALLIRSRHARGDRAAGINLDDCDLAQCAYPGAASGLGLDQPLGCQKPQSTSHRVPSDLIFVAQARLGRQESAGSQPSVPDPCPQIVGELAIEGAISRRIDHGRKVVTARSP